MSSLHEWLKAMRGTLQVLKRECSKINSEKLSKEEYELIISLSICPNKKIQLLKKFYYNSGNKDNPCHIVQDCKTFWRSFKWDAFLTVAAIAAGSLFSSYSSVVTTTTVAVATTVVSSVITAATTVASGLSSYFCSAAVAAATTIPAL